MDSTHSCRTFFFCGVPRRSLRRQSEPRIELGAGYIRQSRRIGYASDFVESSADSTTGHDRVESDTRQKTVSISFVFIFYPFLKKIPESFKQKNSFAISHFRSNIFSIFSFNVFRGAAKLDFIVTSELRSSVWFVSQLCWKIIRRSKKCRRSILRRCFRLSELRSNGMNKVQSLSKPNDKIENSLSLGAFDEVEITPTTRDSPTDFVLRRNRIHNAGCEANSGNDILRLSQWALSFDCVEYAKPNGIARWFDFLNFVQTVKRLCRFSLSNTEFDEVESIGYAVPSVGSWRSLTTSFSGA